MPPVTHGLNDDEARIKVRELIEGIRVVMLVTSDADDDMNARPMSVLSVEDDTVWFFTHINSPKAMQIGQDHQVLLACANPSGNDYVSVRGVARVFQDQAKQAELWTEAARIWIPGGAASPNLGLISVKMISAEYWDEPTSTARFALSYAKALLGKKTADLGENAKVDFHNR